MSWVQGIAAWLEVPEPRLGAHLGRDPIFQDGKYYSGLLVGNSPKFIPLDNSLNRYIFHSLCFHCVLGCFVLDGEGTDKE